MMTFPGMPSIFYGDEKGMEGIEEDEYRHPMVWDGKEEDLLLYYRQLIEFRKAEEVLRRGKFNVLYGPEGKRQFVYARTLEDKQIVICMNMDEEDMNVSNYLGGEVVFSHGLTDNQLQSKGYIVIKK